jgi:tetratricopeptide (TPR) repeat protein
MYGEAGDIFVYAARIAARVDTVSLEKKLRYLDQAKELYSKGSSEDLIWGLNMLIPTYLRLELWNKIVQCFEELFDLYFNLENPEEPQIKGFLDTFMSLSTFEDKIDKAELERFGDLALEAPKRMPLKKDDEMQLLLYVAKNYSHLADKSEESKEHYNDLALKLFEKVREMASPEQPIIAAVLNDSALIYQTRGDDEEALHRLNEAIRLVRQFGSRGSGAMFHYNRAMLHYKNDRREDALTDFEHALEAQSNETAYWNERLKKQDERPLSPNEIRRMRYEKSSLAVTSKNFARFLFNTRDDFDRANELAEQAAQLYLEIGQPDDAEDTRKMAAMRGLFFGDEALDEALMLIVKEMAQRAKKSTKDTEPVTRAWICPTCGGSILGDTPTVCPDCNQQVCSACGAALVPEAKKCTGCESVICPECGIAADDVYAECQTCGTLLPVLCEHCGAEANTDDSVCKQCGQSID